MNSPRHLSFSSSPRNSPSLSSPSAALPPVPPLPAPTRKFSSSTQSTASGWSSGGQAGRLQAPFSPTSPGHSQSMRLDRSVSESSRSTGFGGAGGAGRGVGSQEEDIDQMGYRYSMRVAILHTYLPKPSQSPSAPFIRRPSHSSNPTTPQMPPVPSPSLTGTSPAGSRLTLGYFSAHPSLPSPNPSDTSLPSPGGASTPGSQRRKSSFGFGLKKDKGEEELKLPKEFLVEFWGILGAEQGDQGWKDSVARLLANVKKGTRTQGGANLREMGTLLDAFTQAIPHDAPSPAHAYQHHLLSLLSNYLPRSSYFSPLARQQSDKDKDLLARLRAEVGSYLPSSPGQLSGNGSASAESSDGYFSSAGSRSGSASPAGLLGRASPVSPSWGGGSNALGLGKGPQTKGDEGKTKRKPSPVWPDDGPQSRDGTPRAPQQGQMPWEELVARLWGVEVDRVEREGLQEKRIDPVGLYLIDIKRSLTAISQSATTPSPAQRQRQVQLSTALQGLLQDFPTLATPGSPDAYHESALSPLSPGVVSNSLDFEPSLHFTPPSAVRSEVYSRLVYRAGELGLTRHAQELLDQCRDTWGIPSRREREADLEGMVQPWLDAVHRGSADEGRLGRGVVDCVRDLSGMVGPGEAVPGVLQRLGEKVLKLAEQSAADIFPPLPAPSSGYGTGGGAVPPVPPSPPPPTLMPVLRAGAKVFLVQPSVKAKLAQMADEVRGGAVGAYVWAVGDKMGGVGGAGVGPGRGRFGETGKDAVIEGMEEVARFLSEEVRRVKRGWGHGVGPAFNPAALILSKQLPLFLAELSGLSPPSASSPTRGQASDIFALYEHTATLLAQWDELCPDLGLGRDVLAFEADAFFAPWVDAWLREECGEVGGWVGRIVGMDQWVVGGYDAGGSGVGAGEGEDRGSQSVHDLFDFMRQAAGTIGKELPLGEYQRAVYLVDLAKTTALAVAQYTSTLHALFQTDLNPAGLGVASPTSPSSGQEGGQGIQGRFGKGAGNWLAKGQQAVKGLEINKKKVEGFVIPSVALVKLSNLSTAQRSVNSLADVMDAEECERIISLHRARAAAKSPTSPTSPAFSGLKHIGASPVTQYLFSITIQRGENILSKNAQKAADGFVTVLDRETGERVLKTRTVLGAEDPRWDESFDLSISHPRTLEVQVLDRQLVGKHDVVGTALLPLNPKTWAALPHPTRDVLLPLAPRGMVRVRVTMHGGKNDSVAYHLSTAARVLGRGEGDMVREITDKMGEYVRSQLCTEKLFGLTRPKGWKKGQRTVISEQDVEMALGPLMTWLNENFATFHRTLPSHLRMRLLLALWQLHMTTLIGLMVPPMSDRPYRAPSASDMIGGQETELIFKWLNHLKAFFNAAEDGVEHGVPMALLTRGVYRDLLIVGQYIDLPARELRDRAAQAVRAAAAGMGGGGGGGRKVSGSGGEEAGRAQSPRGGVGGLEQGLGALRLGGAEVEENSKGEDERLAEVLLRIARTRGADLAPFVGEQMGVLNKARVERQGAL